jgi:hypothetical protein
MTCAVVALILAGCALGRSEVDVAVPPTPAAATKQAVTIIEIRDLRPFSVDPGRPELPSLASEAEIADSALKARTIGRTRNAYNMRLGDVVLPEGQTVTNLVRGAVGAALRAKGYAVVDDPAPGVLPLSVDIEQFWAWFEPGLLMVSLEFDSRLRIYGRDIMLDRTPLFVRGRASADGSVATRGAWQRLVQQGLDNLVLKIEDSIAPAEAARSLATVPLP